MTYRSKTRAAKVAIVGAGPAGMATAYLLAKRGLRVHVYEASPHIGGLTRSFKLWNETVDLGPHIFAGYKPCALALWQEVVGADHRWLSRDTRISIGGRVYRYPLQAFELLAGIGLSGASKALLSLAAAQIRSTGAPGSSKHFFTQRFGHYLYALFFEPYCSKLWGLDPDEVDAAFGSNLVGDLTILGALRNKLLGRLSRREASLQARFPYAYEGAGAFCSRAADYVRAHGGQVLVDRPVIGLPCERQRVVGVTTTHDTGRYDWVVSSMPLQPLLRALGHVPEHVATPLRRLRFRSTILVYLHVSGRDIVPHLWMYANDGIQAGRITNFSVWQGRASSADNTAQTLALEYYCTEQDKLWQSDDHDLTQLAIAELAKVARSPHQVLASHVCRVRNTHPVYYRGYQTDLAQVSRHLRAFKGLTVLGRAGNYDYDSQASAIERGIEVACLLERELGETNSFEQPAGELCDPLSSVHPDSLAEP